MVILSAARASRVCLTFDLPWKCTSKDFLRLRARARGALQARLRSQELRLEQGKGNERGMMVRAGKGETVEASIE